tara:strand:+ start:389 stop:889 length:501 start_codon:yes stop_codon:yes gene_type:complete
MGVLTRNLANNTIINVTQGNVGSGTGSHGSFNISTSDSYVDTGINFTINKKANNSKLVGELVLNMGSDFSSASKWHFKNRIQVNGTNEKVGNTADTGTHEKTHFIHLGRNSNFRWDYYYFIPVTFKYTTAGTGDVRFDWYMNKGSTGGMGNIRGGGIQYTVYEVAD